MATTPPPEWTREFEERREGFVRSLRSAVAGSSVLSRVVDADGKVATLGQGTLADAEAFLRHLIDQGHKVAFAVNRTGSNSTVCVSYDCDDEDWSPTWPAGFRADHAAVSNPMTRDWR